jgi:hypothetical protein
LGQVAIYCRVSTDDQCCERQEGDLRAFARRAGHHIVGVFRETASGAKNDRAERKKVMQLAQAREIDAPLATAGHGIRYNFGFGTADGEASFDLGGSANPIFAGEPACYLAVSAPLGEYDFDLRVFGGRIKPARDHVRIDFTHERAQRAEFLLCELAFGGEVGPRDGTDEVIALQFRRPRNVPHPHRPVLRGGHHPGPVGAKRSACDEALVALEPAGLLPRLHVPHPRGHVQ